MEKKPVFEWEGHKVKPSIADRLIIFVIWIATLTLIVGLGVLINKKLHKKNEGRNLIVSAGIQKELPKKSQKNTNPVVEKKQSVVKNEPIVNKTTKEILEKPTEKTQKPVVKNDEMVKKEEKGPFSLRLKKSYKDFDSANSKALEYDLMNFKTMIVPENNRYYIDLEKLDKLSDAQSLLDTLLSGSIEANIVHTSDKFLMPQKKLDEELKKISKLSSNRNESKQTEIKKEEIKTTAEVIKETQKSAVVQKPVASHKPVVNENHIVAQKPVIHKKPVTAQKPIVVQKPKVNKNIDKKPSYLNQIEEKVAADEAAPETNKLIEPKGTYYSLQAGAYREKFGADRLAAFLRNNSELPVFVKKINNFYKVYMGTFRDLNIARSYLNKISFPKFDNENVSFFIATIKN